MLRRQAVLDPHDVDIEGVAHPSAYRIALAGIAECEAAPVEFEHHRSGRRTSCTMQPTAARATEFNLGRQPLPRHGSGVESALGLTA